jgi:hypothetical protein
LKKIEYATGRLVIAFLCYFAWYLIYAILAGYIEFESTIGYVFLGAALLNLFSVGFVFAKENIRVRASVILNLVSFVPVLYYGFITAPKGIS